jgi:hypothetical protein
MHIEIDPVVYKFGIMIVLLIGCRVYVEIKARRGLKNTVYMVRRKKD